MSSGLNPFSIKLTVSFTKEDDSTSSQPIKDRFVLILSLLERKLGLGGSFSDPLQGRVGNALWMVPRSTTHDKSNKGRKTLENRSATGSTRKFL